jgi:hypothetical protein
VYLDHQGHPSSNPVTLYTLSDVNGNVVALADQHGRLAAQYTYEPDGRLRSAEIPAAPATGPPPAPGEWAATIAAARLNRLGFQGLWAERIDVEGATTDTPTAGLDPLGISDASPWPNTTGLLGGTPPETHEVLYFARNRFYSPALNRWTHADPNALGVPVLGTLWWNGGTPTPPAAHFDLTSHYADGLNTHAAFGSNPLTKSDSLGLYVTPLDMMMIGNDVRQHASAIIGNYAFDLEMNSDWALDWSAPDHEHSHAGTGWWTPADEPHGWDGEGSGPLMASVGAARGLTAMMARPRVTRAMATAMGRVAEDAHHIVMQVLGGMRGKNGSRIPMAEPLHDAFHNDLNLIIRKHLGAPGNTKYQDMIPIIDSISTQRLVAFRREIYALMDQYEHAAPGLKAFFRRELWRQRMLGNRQGVFR